MSRFGRLSPDRRLIYTAAFGAVLSAAGLWRAFRKLKPPEERE